MLNYQTSYDPDEKIRNKALEKVEEIRLAISEPGETSDWNPAGDSPASHNGLTVETLRKSLELLDKEKAISVCQDAVARFPESAEANFLLGESLLAAGYSAEAMSAFENAISLEPNSIKYLGRLAGSLVSNGDCARAINYYFDVLRIAGEPLYWAYVGLGNAYENLGQLRIASLYFERAIKHHPADASELQERLRGIYSRLVCFNPRADAFKELSPDQLDEKSAFELNKHIAIRAFETGDSQVAIQYFQEASESYRELLLKSGAEHRTVVNPGIRPDDSSGIYGCIESIDSRGVKGWCANLSDMNFTAKIEVVFKGEVIGRNEARSLSKLASALVGYPVSSEFAFTWPELKVKEEDVIGGFGTLDIYCRIADTDIYLINLAAELPLNAIEGVQQDKASAPIEENKSPGKEIELTDDQLYIRGVIGEHFDENFYRTKYPEIVGECSDLITHYIIYGSAQGLDPSPDFETDFYLSRNHDVRNSHINPYYHYLVAGRNEGRPPKPWCASERNILSALETLEDKAVHWLKKDSAPLLGEKILKLLLDKFMTRHEGILLSVSHDDAMKGVGGIQLAIQQEMDLFTRLGYLYIHIFPKQPLPLLDYSERALLNCYGVSLNGRWVGFASVESLCAAVADIIGKRKPQHDTLFIMHHLTGSNIDSILSLHKALDPYDSYFWLHDYFCLCPQYTLLRNSISYCNAPAINAQGCELCVYHQDRARHEAAMAKLFGAIDLTLISPSEVAADIVVKGANFPFSKVVVSKHQHMQKVRRSGVQGAIRNRKIKVAYLGQTVYHKGWYDYLELVNRNIGNPAYEFYTFGVNDPGLGSITYKYVHVQKENPRAMVEALAEAGIDVVVIGSKWPETFCYTAHEALASGAAIVAHKNSGNVVSVINEFGCGKIYESTDELAALFDSDEIDKLVAASRQWTYLIEDGVFSTRALQ